VVLSLLQDARAALLEHKTLILNMFKQFMLAIQTRAPNTTSFLVAPNSKNGQKVYSVNCTSCKPVFSYLRANNVLRLATFSTSRHVKLYLTLRSRVPPFKTASFTSLLPNIFQLAISKSSPASRGVVIPSVAMKLSSFVSWILKWSMSLFTR